MTRNTTGAPIRVLQLLTLSGGNGEYGGPNRVAREISKSLDGTKFVSRILTGALAISPPVPESGVIEDYFFVRPLLRSFPFSSLWSRKLPKALWTHIRWSQIVHIHLGRDLIPIVGAFICRILRKPYVTHTHGMVVPDNRLSTFIIDKLLIRSILSRSKTNFVLSKKEQSDMAPLNLKCPLTLLPNGISLPNMPPLNDKLLSGKILFVSRLHRRKRVNLFLELAKHAHWHYPELNFEIYGPDGGELEEIISQLRSEPQLSKTRYLGSLSPNKVISVLTQADLLVLPSDNEQFPMVVLESLSVGTPALIMPSCGLAPLFIGDYSALVADTNDLQGLIRAFDQLYSQGFFSDRRSDLFDFCYLTFNISNIRQTIEATYLEALNNG